MTRANYNVTDDGTVIYYSAAGHGVPITPEMVELAQQCGVDFAGCNDYEIQYLESMTWLNHRFHDQPTQLKNIPLTDAEQLALSTHGTPGRNQSQGVPHRSMPIGKLVI